MILIKRNDNYFVSNVGDLFKRSDDPRIAGLNVLYNVKTGRRYFIQADGIEKVNAKVLTKKAVYAFFGLDFKNGHIFHPEFGYIMPLLVNGNKKIGVGCYHFSVLPGNFQYTEIINGNEYTVNGTCICNCPGCYSQSGNYNYSSVRRSLFIKTWLINNDLYFVYRAITAQLIADNIKYCRIHAAGDFNDDMKYVFMWVRIASESSGVKFWTYTKIQRFAGMFDCLDNANIVKSIIDGVGLNYGHCGYILDTYTALKAAGEKVHICRCTYDNEQHCINCRGCSENEYVLFIEHSTEYKAADDPDFMPLVAAIEGQENAIAAA